MTAGTPIDEVTAAAPATAVTAGAENWIDVPDAPPIPGLRFRRYRGPDDHPAMVRIANAQAAAIGETHVRTVPEMDSAMAHPVNTDPFQDVVLAEVGGEAVGWGSVEWGDQTWGGRAYDSWGAVDPAWQRRGIGGALLRLDEQRIHGIGETHAFGGPRWLQTWGPDANERLRALLVSEGYVPVRRFCLMLRPTLDDIDDGPMPDGLEIRPLETAQLRQLFDADVEAFKDHWGGVEDSDEMFQRWITRPSFDPSLFVIAWDGEEIAGGVLCGIYAEENERLGLNRGFLDQVFTRRAWRRRGLARALINRALVLLRDRGLTSAVLGVDASNPNAALPLYESCGFQVVEPATAYRKAWDPAKGAEWEQIDEPELAR